MLRVVEINTAAKLAEHRAAWEQLIQQAPGAELFETYTWIQAWLASYWRDRPLAFVLVYEGEQLVGLAPLLRDEHGEVGCAGALVTPANDQSKRSDIVCVGAPAPIVGAVFDHLSSHYRAPVRVRCAHTEAAAVSAVRKRRSGSLEQSESASPIVQVEGSWDEYLSARPRHLRRELKRKRRKLESTWPVRWRTTGDASTYERAMADVLRVERNSWKHRQGTSFLSEPNSAAFYNRVARGCAAKGWLRLELLYLDDLPVAHIFGVQFKGTYYALKTSYDEVYRAWSPGNVLFQYVLRRVFDDDRLAVFDFLGSGAHWKEEIANATREHVDACAFGPTALRCQWCAARESLVKPWLKRRFPRAVALARRDSGA